MFKGFCLCKVVIYILDEELLELVFCYCLFCWKVIVFVYIVNVKVSSEKLVLYGKEKFVFYSFFLGK